MANNVGLAIVDWFIQCPHGFEEHGGPEGYVVIVGKLVRRMTSAGKAGNEDHRRPRDPREEGGIMACAGGELPVRSAETFDGFRQDDAEIGVHRHGGRIGYSTFGDSETVTLGHGSAEVVQGGGKSIQVLALFGTDIDQQSNMGRHDIGGIGQH